MFVNFTVCKLFRIRSDTRNNFGKEKFFSQSFDGSSFQRGLKRSSFEGKERERKGGRGERSFLCATDTYCRIAAENSQGQFRPLKVGGAARNIFARKACTLALSFWIYTEIRDVCHGLEDRKREGRGERGWKVEIAIWISIKRKFHLPEISGGEFCISEWREREGERVIISRFAQSKYVNIIYFITIFSLLRNNASPVVLFHVYLFLRRWKTKEWRDRMIIWEKIIYLGLKSERNWAITSIISYKVRQI